MNNAPFPEVKNQVWIPSVLTLIWFVIGAVLLYWKWSDLPAMKLNEIGDSLAGFFSPVAFLWLVYGYLQQGKELKLSSDALRLQADELRNSVEQQQELVNVGRQELALAQAAQLNAIDLAKDSIRPELRLVPGGTVMSESGASITDYGIINFGNPITRVSAKLVYVSRLLGACEMLNTAEALTQGGQEAISFKIQLQDSDDITSIQAEVTYDLVNGDTEVQIGKGIKSGQFFMCKQFVRVPTSAPT